LQPTLGVNYVIKVVHTSGLMLLSHDILKGVYFDALFMTNWNLANSL